MLHLPIYAIWLLDSLQNQSDWQVLSIIIESYCLLLETIYCLYNMQNIRKEGNEDQPITATVSCCAVYMIRSRTQRSVGCRGGRYGVATILFTQQLLCISTQSNNHKVSKLKFCGPHFWESDLVPSIIYKVCFIVPIISHILWCLIN